MEDINKLKQENKDLLLAWNEINNENEELNEENQILIETLRETRQLLNVRTDEVNAQHLAIHLLYLQLILEGKQEALKDEIVKNIDIMKTELEIGGGDQ